MPAIRRSDWLDILEAADESLAVPLMRLSALSSKHAHYLSPSLP